WGRHRQRAVGGSYRAIAERDLGVVDALEAEQLDAPNGSNYIENSVDRSDFVKMQIVGRDTVDLGFDRRNCLERGMSCAGNFFRNLHRIDQSVDLGYRAAVGLHGNLEIDFDAAHSGSLHVSDANSNRIEPQRRRK